jgi:hypothetical protein
MNSANLQSIKRHLTMANAFLAGKILLVTFLAALTYFGLSVVQSFLGAYIFAKADAKFTGYGSFRLGLLVTSWMSFCLILSFLVTLPLSIRAFPTRRFRHLLIYAGAFFLFVPLLLKSPPATGVVIVMWRVLSFVAPAGPVQIVIPPLVGILLAAFLFSATTVLVTMPFRSTRLSAIFSKAQCGMRQLQRLWLTEMPAHRGSR